MSAMEETDWRVVKRSRQQLKAIPDDVLEHAECVVSLDISGSSFTDLSNLSLLRKFQNLTSLNLDYCGLNRLPEELFDLVKVQTLSLKRNNLGKGLNASIGKLKALEVLNVADCELSDLPEELWSLEKLENLSLSGNKMAHGLSASISKLQSLKELDIMQCALSNLPEDLWNLQKLEKLSLSGNKMEKGLSASISKLQALKELDVFFCQLSDLPEELWSLDKLEKLSLRGNKMKKGLSASIGKLQALKELNVGWCELSDLPEEMWNLKKLENLSLSGNEMAHGLSASISKLQSLKELVVMECDLCDLPEELWNLQKLEKLSLWGNKMKKGLSASISKLQALKELDVARCELSDLPEELWSLENLEKLSLRGNKMELGLSASISKLQALKELDVTRCLLSDLPEQLWSLEKLEKLSLRGNKMKKGLSASISKLQALKELDVGVCELSDLPEELWSLENLETLRLSGNKMLKGLSPSISKVKSLKNLDVSHCELSDLPEELWTLENLVILWLRNNRLASYPEGSLSLPKLRSLDLSNVSYAPMKTGENMIKELPLGLKDTCLTELGLDGNPIVRPPEAIWKQGLDAIKIYMMELSTGEQKLLRVDTINMIGESEAGKSSIAQSLVEGKPVAVAADDRTRVMQRLKANLTSSSSDSPVYINDFGGHHIYRCIIPLFLPVNGLAILAYNLKAEDWDDQEKKLKNWLLTAIAKSTKIRLLIAGTRSDKVQSCEECLRLKSMMAAFAWDVVNKLKSDVKKHISKLESFRDKANGDSLKNSLKKRLSELQSLKIKLTEASLLFATVSCSETFDDFHVFRELICDTVKAPEVIPARWWQVMQEILKLNTSGFPRRTMDEVKDVYTRIITYDPQCKNLPVILRYLANSSQILWVENDSRLGSSIFHSPQQIVDICTNILDHRAVENQAEKRDQATLQCTAWRPVVEGDCTPRLSPGWEEATEIEKNRYKRGILQETLLKKFLSKYKDQEINEIVAFMEHFDLISEVKLPGVDETQDVVIDPETIEERTFVITSNLPDDKPKDLSALVNTYSKSFSSLFVCLSFVGRIVPLSFFATSMSSILAVTKKECNGRAAPRPWKDGVCITFDNLLLLVECHEKEKEVRFTARSKSSDRSPWFILYPVLQRLQENMSASWPGIAPEWQIMCPGCAWLKERGCSSQQVSRRLIFFKDFTSHLQEEPKRKDEPQVFEDCIHSVPRSLCHLISKDSFTDKEQEEIAKFYKNLEEERMFENHPHDEPAMKYRKTTGEGSKRKKQFEDKESPKNVARTDTKGLRGKFRAELNKDVTKSRQSRPEDIVLLEKFKRDSDDIISRLTKPGVRKMVSILATRGILIESEKEEVLLEKHTPTEAATILVDFILKKKRIEDIRVFRTVLRDDLNQEIL